MLAVGEALAKILEAAPLLSEEPIPLIESAGRILREDIVAPFDLPRFTNSAMDGYAVHSADLENASPATPIVLRIAAKVAAGEPGGQCEAGKCVRVFTGSALPDGADSVVMQEDSHANGYEVKFCQPVSSGEFVRLQGGDIRAGTLLARKGDYLTFGKIAGLSACGIGHVKVARKPTVALLATGSELKEAAGNPSATELFESNRTTLSVLARKAGATPLIFPIVPDDLAATKSALQKAFESSDVVVTTGGVSVGELDFVKEAFRQLGGELTFWRINMRPGKPFVFGHLKEKLLCGLPGNPVSAVVTFFLLARPLILKMQGASNVEYRKLRAPLAALTTNDGNRTHFMRARLNSEGSIVPESKQASHMVSTLLESDGLIEVRPGEILKPGALVELLLWD